MRFLLGVVLFAGWMGLFYAFMRWQARRLMQRVAATARAAGLVLAEGSWRLLFSGFTGDIVHGAWRLTVIVRTARPHLTRVQIRLPRSLSFSPLLSPGPLMFPGPIYHPRLYGSVSFGHSLVNPPQGSWILPPELRARLASHAVWNDGAIVINAEYVEFMGTNRVLEYGACLSEIVEVVVLCTEHVLAIPSVSAA